jgi:hypothetical protein
VREFLQTSLASCSNGYFSFGNLFGGVGQQGEAWWSARHWTQSATERPIVQTERTDLADLAVGKRLRVLAQTDLAVGKRDLAVGSSFRFNARVLGQGRGAALLPARGRPPGLLGVHERGT